MKLQSPWERRRLAGKVRLFKPAGETPALPQALNAITNVMVQTASVPLKLSSGNYIVSWLLFRGAAAALLSRLICSHLFHEPVS